MRSTLTRSIMALILAGLPLTAQAKDPYHYLLMIRAAKCTVDPSGEIRLQELQGKGFDQYYADIKKKGGTSGTGNAYFDYEVKNLTGKLFQVSVQYHDAAEDGTPPVTQSFTYHTDFRHIDQAVWGQSSYCDQVEDSGKIILSAQLSYDPALDGEE